MQTEPPKRTIKCKTRFAIQLVSYTLSWFLEQEPQRAFRRAFRKKSTSMHCTRLQQTFTDKMLILSIDHCIAQRLLLMENPHWMPRRKWDDSGCSAHETGHRPPSLGRKPCFLVCCASSEYPRRVFAGILSRRNRAYEEDGGSKARKV